MAILDELLAHGRAVRAERERARSRAAGESRNFQPLLREWGGVGCAVPPAVGEDTASPHAYKPEGTTLKAGKQRREVP